MDNIYLANALVTYQDDEMLIVRKKNSEYFQMIGGKINGLELPLNTLQREFLEEVNIDIFQHELIFLGYHSTLAVNEPNTMVHANVYRLKLNHIHAIKINSEIEEMAWVTKENYHNYKLAHLLSEFSLPIWLNKKGK